MIVKCPSCKTTMNKNGKQWKCKACLKTIDRQEAEIYARIVGYVRPIDSANEGIRQSIGDRVMFKAEE
jgi:anaerobic ribonucleoside-triphosphate reductase